MITKLTPPYLTRLKWDLVYDFSIRWALSAFLAKQAGTSKHILNIHIVNEIYGHEFLNNTIFALTVGANITYFESLAFKTLMRN